MVTRVFDKENNTLRIRYTDEIDLEIMLLHLDEVLKLKLPERLKMLTEICDSSFIFKSTDIPSVWEKFKEIAVNHEIVYDAIVIDSPKETALNVIFQEMAKNDPLSNYESKIFYTKDAAMFWLDSRN